MDICTATRPEGYVFAKQASSASRYCRTIAQNYMKAADEADELAREHRAMRPHGVMQ